MKKSGSVNVTMAKRAVKQRITWARQWTGLLFTRNNNTDKSSNGNKAKNVPPTPARKATSSSLSSVAMLRTNSSPADLPPPSPIPTGVNNSGSGRFSSLGRALFRHKSNKSISQNSSATSPVPTSGKADLLKIDTKRPLMNGYRKSLDSSQMILDGPLRVQRSQSEISLPQLVARHSVDGSVQHASAPSLSIALSDLSAAQQRAAKRTSTSF
ncbi:hypothetical protein NQZ79_g5920 [Umbelopsis isabellina]|nr:hypothetical protein NQZ79_g5920 [Umbelopsis isabellina]